MHKIEGCLKYTGWSVAIILAGLATGCQGGAGSRAPILGGGGSAALAPTVTATAPANLATGVSVNTTTITASFSEKVLPFGNGATFTVTCAAPGVNPTGTVTLDSTGQIATFTTILAPYATYTATVTGAESVATGLALAVPYSWTFTTGAGISTTRPRVSLTVPATTLPGPTANVPTNTAVTAVFSAAMAPATLKASSFTLTTPAPGVEPTGTVTYSVGSRTAIFTPSTTLAPSTTYTATITLAATDTTGNALAGNQAALPAASNYVWTFTTGLGQNVTAPQLTLASPANLATNVAINSSVSATFNTPMNPTTLSTATFTLQPSGPPLGTNIVGAVSYDALTNVATFTPSSPLATNTTYTATVTDTVTDLDGNLLAPGPVSNPWTFKTASSGSLAQGAIALGSSSTFGLMATSAITSTGFTVINGDVSLDPGTSMSGFPAGVVNGSIHIDDTVAAQARLDLLTAYNTAKALPPGTTITAGADLGALYPLGIPPGTYTSGSTMLVATPLILDAAGNADAVWVFQIGSSLTTGASVSLANGAQAKNVFWVPTLDATVGVGTIFCGTIISGRSVTGVTGATINGRILAGATTAGTIALDSNTVNVPAP